MKQAAVYQKQPVLEYTIENEVLRVTVLNFGGTISGIYFKEDGKETNMVASYANKQDYIDQGGPYLNALVGPVAGRIAYGRYHLRGPRQLSINNGAHHLHGGASGISKKLFTITQVNDTQLRLQLDTSHEEDGYPKGIYHYDIRYTLNEDALCIKYHCTPPAVSLLNMTSHLYFNLNGMNEDIRHHQLQMASTKKCRIEKECHPSEIYEIKANSAFDFTTLRDIQLNLEKGDPEFQHTIYYDTPFLLDEGNLTLYDPKSHHQLQISTDQSSVVVYTANWFDDKLTFENNSKGKALCCIALETQDVPNGINMRGYQHQQVYDPTHPYTQTTTYRFTKP